MELQHVSSSPELDGFVALVGIDWADQKHDIAVQAAGATRVELQQINHTPEVLDDWLLGLRRRFQGQIAVVVELSRGPLINALLKYDFVTIFPLPPARLASYRKAFSSSGAKDDPVDAELALDYLRKHADKLRPWVPDDPQTRELASLCEIRRKLVDLQTGHTNSLNSALKNYFPQAREWLDLRTDLACVFLQRWPTLESLQKTRPNSIRAFMREHRCRSRETIESLVGNVQSATPLTTDPAVIGATVMLVQALLKQIKALNHSLRKINKRIQELFVQHSDAFIYDSLPGAGKAMAPRLLTSMGTDRTRYGDAVEVQTYSGTAAVTSRSGKKTRIHRRYACPRFMKQTFHEFAGASIRFCPWARAYYDVMRDRGSKHHAAVRALAYKWIRIIYACWRDRVPYDDARYTEALRRAGSPLVKLIPAPCAETVKS